MARTVLTIEDLAKINHEYGNIPNSSLAKKWHIGVPRLIKEMDTLSNRKANEVTAKRKIAGTKLSEEEDKEIAHLYTEEYMSMAAVSKQILRSPTAVRSSLVRNNIPVRNAKNKTSDKLKFSGDTESKIVVGDKVYSSKYNEYALVLKCLVNNVYRIWVLEPKSESVSAGFSAYQNRTDLFFIRGE